MSEAILNGAAAALEHVFPNPLPPSSLAWFVILPIVLWLGVLATVRVHRRLVIVESAIDVVIVGVCFRLALWQQTRTFPVGFGAGGYMNLVHALALDRAKGDVLLLLALLGVVLVGVAFTLVPVAAEPTEPQARIVAT